MPEVMDKPKSKANKPEAVATLPVLQVGQRVILWLGDVDELIPCPADVLRATPGMPDCYDVNGIHPNRFVYQPGIPVASEPKFLHLTPME